MKTVAQPSSIEHDVDDPDDLSTVYNIVEIFHSVQGEGFEVGFLTSSFALAAVTFVVSGAIPILTPMNK